MTHSHLTSNQYNNSNDINFEFKLLIQVKNDKNK